MRSFQWLSLIESDRAAWFLIFFLFLVGCQLGSERSYSFIETDCSGCLEALPNNGWCDRCDHGLVAGLVVSSRVFHEALDAHGHEVDTETILCNLCRQVAREDQFCPRCRHGFVAGQLYFSELTWALARGESGPTDIRCGGCRKQAGRPGRCEVCETYWVGTVRFMSVQDAQRAEGQYRRLQVALDRLPNCSECAVAGFFGFSCRSCDSDPIPNPLQ